MDLIDALVRFAGVGLLFNLAVTVLREPGRPLTRWVIAGWSLSVSAILINSSPFPISDEVRFVLKVFETPNAILCWWFGLLIFTDGFRLRLGHWVIAGAMCVLSFSIRLHYYDIDLPLAQERMTATYAVMFAMMAHLLWRVVRDASGDLISQRRSARFWLAIAAFAITAITAWAEITLAHAQQSLLRAVFVLASVLLAYVWLTRFQSHNLVFAQPEAPKPAQHPGLDSALGKALDRAMKSDRVYLEAGLTVAGLAARLGVAEHRLRAHINRETGFRNFASFINHHRLDAAKAALSDPAKVREPILGIALDTGFASLSTFNRVFKEAVGEAPSDFRRRALGQTSA